MRQKVMLLVFVVVVVSTITIAAGLIAAAASSPTETNSPADCTEAFPAHGGIAGGSVLVENRYCNRTVRVRAVIDWGPDSPCVSLKPKKGFRHEYWTGDFSHVTGC